MSESPPSTWTEHEPASSQKKQVTFRFCQECGNMLYPREDRVNLELKYRCRTCNYEESAGSYCVFRNELGSQIAETAGVTTEVGSDPTLPRAKKTCDKCSNTEAVFFQSQQRTEDTGMVLFYVCCACGNTMK